MCQYFHCVKVEQELLISGVCLELFDAPDILVSSRLNWVTMGVL